MNQFYFCLFLFIACITRSFAQSNALHISPPQDACVNATVTFEGSTQGIFNAGNTFKMRLRRANQTSYFEIPAVFRDGKFEINIPAPQVTVRENYEMQVVSTSPAVASEWSGRTEIHAVGEINILNSTTDTVNRYRPLEIKVDLKSSSDGTATLSDSSIYYFNYMPGLVRYPEVSGTYTIVRASNFCGPMKVGNGQARVYVNPTAIRTTMVTPHVACLGSEISVAFMHDGAAFPANTRFKLRITQAGVYPEPISPNRFELPATLKDGYLVARLPENLPVKRPTFFTAVVLMEGTPVVGEAGDRGFRIYPKPVVNVITNSQTIHPAHSPGLAISYRGPHPYTIRLSDDSQTGWDEAVLDSMVHVFPVTPQKTTEYFVKSIETVCSAVTIPTKKVTFTVSPGLVLSHLEGTPLCEGTKARLPFTANVTLPAQTVFSIKITHNGEQRTIPATRIGSEVEFTVPAYDDRKEFAITRLKTFEIQLLADSPALTSNVLTGKTILGKPDIDWGPSPRTIEAPGFAEFNIKLYGGGDYYITTQNGYTGMQSGHNQSSFARLFATAPGEYSLKSIRNACFTNESPSTVRINFKNPAPAVPVIAPSATRTQICKDEAAEIDIAHTSGFSQDNEFKIQVSRSYCCNYETIKTVKQAGKAQITLPFDDTALSEGKMTYYVKVVSTSPAVESNAFEVTLNAPVTDATVNYLPTANSQNTTPPVQIMHKGGPISSVTYSDGKAETTVDMNLPTINPTINVPVQPGDNAFTIRSVSTVCGTKTLNLPVNIRRDAYRIRVAWEYLDPYFCTGSTMQVPFGLLDSQAPGAQFSLQISSDAQHFTTIGTPVTGRLLEYKIPADMERKPYRIRVISSDGVVSYAREFKLGSAPAATVTAKDRTGSGPFELKAGETIQINVALTGSTPQWVVADGLWEREQTNANFTIPLEPTTSGTFTIKSVSNACGYGTGTGSVSYKLAPVLTARTSSTTFCGADGVSVIYDLKGESDLAKDFIRFDLINELSKKLIRLDSTKITSGTRRLALPAGLAQGYYRVRVYLKQYNLNAETVFRLDQRPVVSLISHTTINPGGQAILIVSASEESSVPIFYTISNGASGSFTPFPSESASVLVAPKSTTTYQITSAYNVCGAATITGNGATVTVNPASSRTIDLTKWNSVHYYNYICGTDSVQVHFTTTGTFSAGNRFQVQLSDSTGRNFRNIPTSGTASPLLAVIPGDLFRSDGYRMRVVATDADVAIADFRNPLRFRFKPTVRFVHEAVGYEPNTITKAAILLTGDYPWDIRYSNSKTSFTARALTPADSLVLYSAVAGEVYKLNAVTNFCGPGKVIAPATVTIEVITGAEDPALPGIVAFPNPTRDFITLKPGQPGKYQVTLYDLSGRLLDSFSAVTGELLIDLRRYPAGMLLLNVTAGQRKTAFRIVRQ